MREPLDTDAVRANWRCCAVDPAEQRSCEQGAVWHAAWRTIAALCDALDAERARAEELVAVLRRVEWMGGGTSCPCCGDITEDGHAAGCRLAAALRTAPDANSGPSDGFTPAEPISEASRGGKDAL